MFTRHEYALPIFRPPVSIEFKIPLRGFAYAGRLNVIAIKVITAKQIGVCILKYVYMSIFFTVELMFALILKEPSNLKTTFLN